MTFSTRLLRRITATRAVRRPAPGVAGMVALLACVATPLDTIAAAGPPAPSDAAESKAPAGTARRAFTDAEIVDGFFKIAFGAELNIGGRVDRVRKYDRPVRVFITDGDRPDRRRRLEAVIADIRDRIAGLDIAVTSNRSAANMTVTLVRDRDLPAAIGRIYGRDRLRRIEKSLQPQCLSGFRKDDSFRIVNSDVILVVDAGDFVFTDCAYEEVLQALGPINDDESVPWTMFNDDVRLGFFGLYDQYLLNILYHPRIRPGMSRDEVAASLPQVLPEVRAFVAGKNGLGP